MRIRKICDLCLREYEAKTTVTRHCSDYCAKRAYKARKRAEKIGVAANSVQDDAVDKMARKVFLTVREVSLLLNCSPRTVYQQIKKGHIRSANLGNRLTRVRKSDIDKMFNR